MAALSQPDLLVSESSRDGLKRNTPIGLAPNCLAKTPRLRFENMCAPLVGQ